MKRASSRKYLRGLGNPCSSAAYINVLTPFRAAYNRINTVVNKIWLPPYHGCHSYRRRLICPWLLFVNQTLFSHSLLFGIMCTFHHRRDYDEQKAAVVVWISLPGLPIKREMCSCAKVSSAAYNRINTVVNKIWLPPYHGCHSYKQGLLRKLQYKWTRLTSTCNYLSLGDERRFPNRGSGSRLPVCCRNTEICG